MSLASPLNNMRRSRAAVAVAMALPVLLLGATGATAAPAGGPVLTATTSLSTVAGESGNIATNEILAVSMREFNRFVFPEPALHVYFTDNAPLPETKDAAPKWLNGNRMLLVQFTQKTKKPVQMVIPLQSGRVLTLRVNAQDVPGQIIRVDGAKDVPDAPVAAKPAPMPELPGANGFVSPHEYSLELLKTVARGIIPEGYRAMPMPAPVQFDKFLAVPVAAYTDDASRNIYVTQLHGTTRAPVTISPTQFYRPGVLSVAVDGTEISENSYPTVLIVEDAPRE